MKLALLLACCALPCCALPGHAATLKPFTTLAGPTVLLSDLFDGADPRPLGPAPAPGARITVDAPQLAAIARMFGVAWSPVSPSDRAVLERPGRAIAKSDLLPPLREALEAAGAPHNADLELPGFTAPLLPANTQPTIDVADLNFSPATGRFTTLVTATAEGAPPVQIRLSGRVQEMTELPVPTRAMHPGDVIAAADLQWTRLRVGLARGDLVRTPAQAEGQALRRPLQPGQPIQLADLGRPIIVAKGTPLLLSLDSPGIQLTAQAVATEPGGIGDVIKVRNPYSHTLVDAEVTAPGRARVLPTQPELAAKVAAR